MAFDLSKQIGPLPLGMWLLVGTGGIGVAYVINKQMAKNAAGAGEPSTAQLTESGVGAGSAGQLIYTPPSTVPTQTDATNDAWGRNVTNWLVTRGISPTAADQAVRKYLAGNALTTAELAMLNLAIVQFGVPPQSLPPAEELPPTEQPPAETVVPPTAPVNVRVNPATRRNDIVWEHDGKNVTHFFVQAKARATGETITAQVGAYPLQTRYVWSHFLPGSAPGNMTYDYLVVAWNGKTMGGQGTTASNFKM